MDPAEYTLMDTAEDHLWWYRALHTRLSNALTGINGRVLDAGCGTGGFLTTLKSRRPDLIRFGTEWNQTAANRAQTKSASLITRGSINTLPFATASFNAVVSADVLCHEAVDPPAALAEMKRVLKPGGRLVLNLPAYQWMLSSHDRRVHNVRRFTARTTATLLRTAGFENIRTSYWNSLLFPLMLVQRKLLARGKAVSDVAAFPPWLDHSFHATTEFERTLAFSFPVGGSVLAIAEQP